MHLQFSFITCSSCLCTQFLPGVCAWGCIAPPVSISHNANTDHIFYPTRLPVFSFFFRIFVFSSKIPLFVPSIRVFCLYEKEKRSKTATFARFQGQNAKKLLQKGFYECFNGLRQTKNPFLSTSAPPSPNEKKNALTPSPPVPLKSVCLGDPALPVTQQQK